MLLKAGISAPEEQWMQKPSDTAENQRGEDRAYGYVGGEHGLLKFIELCLDHGISERKEREDSSCDVEPCEDALGV